MQIPDGLDNKEQFERLQFFAAQSFVFDEHSPLSLSDEVVDMCEREIYEGDFLWSADFAAAMDWDLAEYFYTRHCRIQKATE